MSAASGLLRSCCRCLICSCGRNSNGLIVTFTSSKLADFLGTSNRLLLFLLIEHALMLVLLVIKVVVDDVPEDVQLQMDRQDYLVRKIIDHEPYHDDDGTYAGLTSFTPSYHLSCSVQ